MKKKKKSFDLIVKKFSMNKINVKFPSKGNRNGEKEEENPLSGLKFIRFSFLFFFFHKNFKWI